MDRPLHILLVDDRPDSVFLLSEFLLKRHHRVEVSSDMREALGATLRRRGHGDPYDLVIANASMPAMNGLELLRELRSRNDPTMVALIDPFGDLDASSYREAEALGCATFLDKPIDLGKIERLLAVVSAAHGLAPTSASQPYRRSDSQIIHGSDQFVVKPASSATYQRTPSSPHLPANDTAARHTTTTRRSKPEAEEPFFGTARVVRPVGGGTDRAATKPAAPPTLGGGGRSSPPLTPNPFSGSYAPAPHAPKSPDPLAGRLETSRTRRSVSSVIPPSELHPPVDLPPKGALPLPAGTTSLARKPAAGELGPSGGTTSHNNPRTGAAERRVLCAACRKEFLVATRPQEFTVNCVHCGQLNRVQPRTAR